MRCDLFINLKFFSIQKQIRIAYIQVFNYTQHMMMIWTKKITNYSLNEDGKLPDYIHENRCKLLC